MNDYLDLAWQMADWGVDWVAPQLGAALVLLGTLPTLVLLKGGGWLRYGALASLAAAIILVVLHFDGPSAALVVAIVSMALVAAGALSIRRRCVVIEGRLEAMVAAIRDLELAEERRQMFGVRSSAEFLDSPRYGAIGLAGKGARASRRGH